MLKMLKKLKMKNAQNEKVSIKVTKWQHSVVIYMQLIHKKRKMKNHCNTRWNAKTLDLVKRVSRGTTVYLEFNRFALESLSMDTICGIRRVI